MLTRPNATNIKFFKTNNHHKGNSHKIYLVSHAYSDFYNIPLKITLHNFIKSLTLIN